MVLERIPGTSAAAFAALRLALLAFAAGWSSALPFAAPPPRSSLPASGPAKAVVKYAEGFTLRYSGSSKIVEVFNPFSQAPDTQRYVLVPRGRAAPADAPKATRVEIPVRGLVCMSTTHIGMLGFLGATDRIVGLSDTARLLNPTVLARARAGKIAEVGRDGSVNEERILALAPDLVMTVAFTGKELGAYRASMESGIAVVANAEWMETTPLGRMEWVKLVGAFLDLDALAERKFDSVAAEYARVERLAAAARTRPKVIGGLGRKGVWTVPGGKSYMAALLRDAGAEYPFADDSASGIRNLPFETVYRAGLDADIWLNAGPAKTLGEIGEEDARYRDFKAFRNRRVFGNLKRMAPNGGNEYWETGVVSPHLILSDLVEILHPGLLPGYRPYYMQALE